MYKRQVDGGSGEATRLWFRPPSDGGPGAALREGTWQLEVDLDGAHRLYDLASDPGRSTDRYGDPSLAETVRALEVALVRRLAVGLGPPHPRGAGDRLCLD